MNHATIARDVTVCGFPRTAANTRVGGVTCPACLAILDGRRPRPAHRHIPRRRWRRWQAELYSRRYAIAWAAIVGLLLAAGIVGLALTRPIPGIG